MVQDLLSTAGDAYRRAHHRFSDPVVTTGSDTRPRPAGPSRGATVPAWVDEPTLLEVFNDAMERLDRINPETG